MVDTNYTVTDDVEIIKRFLKVAPTKYLIGLMKLSKKSEYREWSRDMLISPVSAKWSFGKDENYKISFRSSESINLLKTELATRENIKSSKKK